jgi:hypothetical protein
MIRLYPTKHFLALRHDAQHRWRVGSPGPTPRVAPTFFASRNQTQPTGWHDPSVLLPARGKPRNESRELKLCCTALQFRCVFHAECAHEILQQRCNDCKASATVMVRISCSRRNTNRELGDEQIPRLSIASRGFVHAVERHDVRMAKSGQDPQLRRELFHGLFHFSQHREHLLQGLSRTSFDTSSRAFTCNDKTAEGQTDRQMNRQEH